MPLTSCRGCGAQISTEARFCPQCGTPGVSVAPPGPAGDPSDPGRPRGNTAYNVMADKVGFVANVRGKDNLIQGICVLVAIALGAGIGWFAGKELGAVIGGIAGMIGGILVSGAILAIVGLVRRS